jgi:proteasome lid subunit RPN8/RPN11
MRPNSLTLDLVAAIRVHAAREYPRESCGLLVRIGPHIEYRPCRNDSVEPGAFFRLNAEDYAAVEDAGKVIAVVHSHPNASAAPSDADYAGCAQSGLPWLIVGCPSDDAQWIYPEVTTMPLYGRSFCHGVTDCYTLIRDYYAEQGIALANHVRDDEWWLKGQNLYVDGFEGAGFVRITDGTLQKHDALLMQIRSPVPNHAAVYLGDGLIAHHLYNRLSARDVYGGWLRKCTTHTLRHRSLM